MRSLLIAEFDSIGEGYELITATSEGLEVLEMIPSAAGSAVMIAGDESALRELTKNRSTTTIVPFSAAVERAWLGLTNSSLTAGMGVFESESIASVFSAAAKASERNVAIVDLRILRGGKTKAYMIVTGSPKDLFADLKGRTTEISNPSVALRELFEIQA